MIDIILRAMGAGISAFSIYQIAKLEHPNTIWAGLLCFGRRSSGYFDIRKLDGTKVHAGISCKKIILVETCKHYLTEWRMAIPPRPVEVGVSLP